MTVLELQLLRQRLVSRDASRPLERRVVAHRTALSFRPPGGDSVCSSTFGHMQ